MRKSAIAILVVAPLLSIGCKERDLDKVRLSEEKVVHAGEIAKHPGTYYGRPVTVVAPVEAVHGPNAFTLDEDEAIAGPDVLVIVPQAGAAVEEKRQVTVHGTVRPLVLTELQRDYSWFNPSTYAPDVLNQFKGRPVIIADSVRDDQGGDKVAGAATRQPPVD
jgi:hypothetical protein